MQCPKCQGTMELIVEPEASAHRCTRCKGLWFEMMAHETLKHRAEEIDTGDPVLLIERRGSMRDGRVVEFTRSYYRGDSYDFVAEL